jgi:hypothetical protein
VLADWLALGIAGLTLSISRELNVVDASLGSMIGESLTSSAFIVLGLALAAEAADRFRVPPMVSTIVIAIGAGVVGAADQRSFLPALALVAGMSLSAAVLVFLYRSRGFLAAFVAGVTAGLLQSAMALRSHEDPDLSRTSGFLIAIVVLAAAAGAWGIVKPLMRKAPAEAPQRPSTVA